MFIKSIKFDGDMVIIKRGGIDTYMPYKKFIALLKAGKIK